MFRRSIAPFLLSLGIALPRADASAQDATVFVTHRLAKQGVGPTITHRLATDDTSRRRAGLPSILDVQGGSRVCVVVERANPVLYSYSLTSKAIQVAPPDTMAAALKALLALAQGATPKMATTGILAMAGAKPGQIPDTSYVAAVAALYRQYLGLVELKTASDTATDFPGMARRIGTLFADSAKSYDKIADAVYDSLRSKSDLTARMLRAQQIETFQKSTSIAEEFTSGVATASDPICTGALTGRSRVVLAIAPQLSGKDAARVTGDSVLAFSVDAAADQDFEFGAGVLVNVLSRSPLKLAVENGLVVQKAAEDVLIHPIFLGHYRNWGQRWLYATIGTAVSGKDITDVFLGATSRFGVRSGVGITFGAGLALSQQEVGLAKGSIGQPLPDDVANLSDIVKKQLKPGLGVTLAISGF